MKVLILEGGISAFTVRNDAATCKERENMKICKMAISSVAVLLVLLCAAAIPMCVSAEEAAIVTAGGRAFVGNGLPGVAMVASYDKRGRLMRLETKPVAKDCIARLDAKTGDKVMFWDGLGTMNMLSNAVTVTEDKTKGDGGNYDKAVYERAVQSALYDALGTKKGEGMTELQKALALHDWLVMNCQYDTTVRRPYVHSEYGAIVNGFAVCAGYAKAYNDLLSRVGIKATYVTGMKPLKPGTNPQPHAWSRVTIDGVWYYVDVTADDPVPDQPGNVCRSFFLVSDDVLNANDYDGFTTHCTDKRYEKYDLLTGFYMAFMWNEKLQRFYYIDLDKVKTTADFTETMAPSSEENGAKPSSCFITNDGKYLCFFRPGFITSQATVYLYSFATDEYYTHAIRDIKDVVHCRIRQNGDNIEVGWDYYKNEIPIGMKAEVTIPFPSNLKKRNVTFDPNYSGGKITSCEYLDSNWRNGDGSFDEPDRGELTFGGWYTQKDGGTRVDRFEDIPGDDVTLYAHWWGAWKMSEEPTLTESGKAVRALEGYPDVTEEISIPNLSDTSVWEKRQLKEATIRQEGRVMYTSVYGRIFVTLPKLKPEAYGIEYRDGKVYIIVLEEDEYTYQLTFESDGNVRPWNITTTGAGEWPVMFPPRFTPSGTLKVTLYDNQGNELCAAQFDVS